MLPPSYSPCLRPDLNCDNSFSIDVPSIFLPRNNLWPMLLKPTSDYVHLYLKSFNRKLLSLRKSLYSFSWHQDWLQNLQGPVQNEKAELVKKLLGISRQQEQSIKQCPGPFWAQGMSNCTGCMPRKQTWPGTNGPTWNSPWHLSDYELLPSKPCHSSCPPPLFLHMLPHLDSVFLYINNFLPIKIPPRHHLLLILQDICPTFVFPQLILPS